MNFNVMFSIMVSKVFYYLISNISGKKDVVTKE